MSALAKPFYCLKPHLFAPLQILPYFLLLALESYLLAGVKIGSWNPGGSRGIPHPSIFLKNQEVGLQDLNTFWDSGLGHPKRGLWLMRCQLFSVCSPTSLLREPNAHSCPRHQFQRVWLEIKGYRTKTRFCSCPQTHNAASIVQRTEIELG